MEGNEESVTNINTSGWKKGGKQVKSEARNERKNRWRRGGNDK